MGFWKRIFTVLCDGRFVEEACDPPPNLRSQIESLRYRMVEFRKSATRLRHFNREKEAKAKDYEADKLQKEITELSATLPRNAA